MTTNKPNMTTVFFVSAFAAMILLAGCSTTGNVTDPVCKQVPAPSKIAVSGDTGYSVFGGNGHVLVDVLNTGSQVAAYSVSMDCRTAARGPEHLVTEEKGIASGETVRFNVEYELHPGEEYSCMGISAQGSVVTDCHP